jgi:leukotriene-A4 hydrolase
MMVTHFFACRGIQNLVLIQLIRIHAAIGLAAALTTSCSMNKKNEAKPSIAHDIHSYANPERVQVRHLNLDLKIVFEQQTIQGTAILTIEQHGDGAKQLILDSRALQIDETEVSPDGLKYREAPFTIGNADKILGAPLRIDIKPDSKFVKIRYSTDPTATALQWLAPEQTAGKQHPFLCVLSASVHEIHPA